MSETRRIDVRRFIEQLDRCFERGDMEAARGCLRAWEAEARAAGDARGLLAVLDEQVGFYRRAQEETPALAALRECLALLERLGLSQTLSGATVCINAATTLSAFGRVRESLPLYGRAAACFEAAGRMDAYEYAALLNNQASALNVLGRTDEAEKSWRQAVAILKNEGNHDAEIAVSLLMLAHLTYDRDETAVPQVEALLDEAWEYVNSPRQPHDGRYAEALLKCAPSFEYFQRPEAAQALREVAEEIYERA